MDAGLGRGGTTLDPLPILAALGISSPDAVMPVTGGWDTAIWRVGTAQGQYALRVLRADQREAHDRERAALTAAHDGGVPVPALVAVGSWRDRPVQLLEWRTGTTLLAALRDRPWRVWPLGVRFGQLHAKIHAVRLPTAPWARPWIPLIGPDEASLQSALAAAVSPETRLLHLDYHPLNVLCVRGAPSTVLDWTNATAGDPRADFARTITILRLAPDPPESPRLAGRAVRMLLEAGYRRGYVTRDAPRRDMPLFYAWAGAMMLRDLAPRAGHPVFPVTARHLARIRAWTAAWKRRAKAAPGAPGNWRPPA